MSKLVILALLASLPLFAEAKPAQVLVIRHAEKPEDDADPHLSAKGRERAQALIAFFQNNASVNKYGPPVAIYAAAPKDEDSSLRSIETATPLANALHLKVHDEFTANDEKEVAKAILKDRSYEGKTVLVVWAHDEIPKVAKKLGVENAPDKWKKKRFDRVWKISYAADGTTTFEDIPQHVMAGDQ